jgi:hypothetical protein
LRRGPRRFGHLRGTQRLHELSRHPVPRRTRGMFQVDGCVRALGLRHVVPARGLRITPVVELDGGVLWVKRKSKRHV